ncbi:isopentenyl-diphosphate Delta-isomerase [Zhihengliuella halotolerans]|uniref:Isopentenyl-diphosphate Delta-isomerase n=1 Tax=Zhihengliuella halotolerans TaxID=370736 RepID=A0A4Q8AGL1_9MICC|nr:isopentenyl-diphosphate Delta-isomerase [Zhihengliuella halotolerans]RZU62991.1 isopentenyl-diphosphate delta-isomerase [Zhihengliuella halotolerans]
MTELVVLLGEDGAPTGTFPKADVHTEDTPLHFAFSCHVYDAAGRVLLTRRALSKVAWPGVWTNAFCGHPGPGEAPEAALERRAQHELGLEVSGIEPVLPDFRYWARDSGGIVENEVCPVFRATAAADPVPHQDEVAEWAWVEPGEARRAVLAAPFAFSPWLVLQVEQGVWG